MTFGYALVVHEKESSFIWVLKQLIEAGDGQTQRQLLQMGTRQWLLQLRSFFQKQ